ncbi:MAG: MarR family transcriptional regulator [Baekduia sp.]
MCNHLVIPGQLQTTSSLASGDPDLQVWRSIFRLTICLGRELDHRLEREHGLPLSSLQALICLEEQGGRMRMSDLAEAAGLSRSGLTRLADRLEAGGLLSRDRCCDDARGAFACLTEAGSVRIAEARVTYRQAVDELLLAHISAEERSVISTALERAAGEGLGGCGCAT